MINFSSFFNHFRSPTNVGLNELLDLSGTKMGRLIDQDSFVSQYKSANPRIIQFMKYDRYLELVQFITVVGHPNDKKRSYKYPLNSSDILCIDNSQALQFFLPEKPIIQESKVIQTVLEDLEIQLKVATSFELPTKQQSDAGQLQPRIVANAQEKASENIQNQTKQDLTQEEKVNSKLQLSLNSQEKDNKSQLGEQVAQQKVPIRQDSIILLQNSRAKVPIQTQKNIIKVQKKIQKVIIRQLSPLITKLLLYFDGPINYTLAGYVSKVLTYLFTKKPAEFLKYIFEGDITAKILNHAESRSVGDLIVKILTFESTLYLQKRGQLFKDLLSRLSVPSQVYIMSNLSAYACEVIEKIATNLKGNNKVPQFNTVLFPLQIITSILTNVVSEDENVSVYNAPALLTYLTNVPFVLPQDTDIIEAFKALLENFIDKGCEKLQVSIQNRPKLGIGRIKIIQILRFVLKENILNAKDIVSTKTDFFSILFNLMKNYSMNNLLHNEIVKILDVALSQPQESPLNKLLFEGKNLLNFLVEEAKDDIKIRSGTSVYKTRKGYAAHLINLALKLKQLSDKNSHLKALTDSQQFTNIFESFIEKEMFKTKRNLAGYSLKKEQKHQIMFQKQDIIANYITFFQKCPTAVFETKEAQPKNIGQTDLVQELQKQLSQNLNVKPKEQPQTVEMRNQIQELTNEKTPEEIQAEAEASNKNFWVMHLDYNVDDLLAEL